MISIIIKSMRDKKNSIVINIISFFVLCSCCFQEERIKEIEIKKEYFENGQLKSAGATIEKKKNGYWITYDKEGNREYEATYYNDALNGVFIIYFKNGQKKMEANMMNDLYHGYRINYYYNKQIKSEGNYYNGKKNGLWISYNDEGEIDKKAYYKEGELIETILDNKLSPPLPPR